MRLICACVRSYGTPQGICKETAPGSMIFTREWTKSTATMDCNAQLGRVEFK